MKRRFYVINAVIMKYCIKAHPHLAILLQKEKAKNLFQLILMQNFEYKEVNLSANLPSFFKNPVQNINISVVMLVGRIN